MNVPDYAVYMDTQQTINLALMRRFEAEGIDFAYATLTLFIGGGAGRCPPPARTDARCHDIYRSATCGGEAIDLPCGAGHGSNVSRLTEISAPW